MTGGQLTAKAGVTDRLYFTQAAAQAALGRRMLSRVRWDGVPKGTTGIVNPNT